MRLAAVTLDLDGTLVNSSDAQAMAWLEALRRAGFKDTSFTRVRPLIGMPADRLLNQAAGVSLDSTDGRSIARERARIFSKRYLPGVKAFNGARELLERMKRQGLRLIIVSAATVEETSNLVWAAGIPDLIDDTVTASDLPTEPDTGTLLRAALERSGVSREAALFVGDTPYDIEAGQQTGLGVVALRCGGWAESSLEGALAVYRDPRDLLRNYSMSPFLRDGPHLSKGTHLESHHGGF